MLTAYKTVGYKNEADRHKPTAISRVLGAISDQQTDGLTDQPTKGLIESRARDKKKYGISFKTSP